MVENIGIACPRCKQNEIGNANNRNFDAVGGYVRKKGSTRST